MAYSWDEAKRATNLQKHKVDFASVVGFEWDTAFVRASLQSAEPRLFAMGYIATRLHALVFSIETRNLRVISLRHANIREVNRYERER